MTNEQKLEKYIEAYHQQQQSQDQQDLKEIPSNDLDLQFQLIEPGLQRPKQGLKNKLSKQIGSKKVYISDENGNIVLDEKGQPVQIEQPEFQNYADHLQFWVRDFRLGNLSQWTGEYDYVINRINLAADFLVEGHPKAALVCLNKALSILEVSSSKAAKLRELIQTIRRVTSIENSSGGDKPDFKVPKRV